MKFGRSLHRSAVAASLLLASGFALAYGTPASTASANATTVSPQSKTSAKPAKPVQPLDLNTASKTQLTKLPWIGTAEADRIIAARPFVSKADIVTEAGIPLGVYQAIRHQIVVIPKTLPHPKNS